MSDTPFLIYLEADDEITAVVRRVRDAEPGLVVIVAPGRSRATSSVVALRLLARAGADAGRELAIVGDGLTRSLAVEAGLMAYGTVDDARRAEPAAPGVAAPRHAAIHVVRGAPRAEAPTVEVAAARGDDMETRAVPVVRPAPAVRPTRRRRVRLSSPLPILAVAGVLLVGVSIVAAAILPGATVRIAPATQALGPFPYEVRIADPDRREGTVEEGATVTATGTYPIEISATGAVVFFNWNFVPVEVAAGTLVAAGDQAFETVEGVVVPAGDLTSDGTIQAGEGSVGVSAAAPGPDANVAVAAIDTVLNQGTAARLRGFPSNRERLVTNPEPTSGGLLDTGVEIIQADVDAAVAALREALTAAAADALAGTEERPHADPVDPIEAIIEGVDGLVGTRDEESAEISGTLAFDRLSADPDEVTTGALAQFGDASGVVPDGHALVEGATDVQIGDARRDDDELVVATMVTARAAPTIDRTAVLSRIIGRTSDEAEAALADLGDATVELWPGWVGAVPDSDWRIEIEVVDQDRGPEPSAS